MVRHNGEYMWPETGADKTWELSKTKRLVRYPDGEYRLEGEGVFHTEVFYLTREEKERLTDILLAETVAC